MATNLTPWNGLDVEKLKVWVHHILPLVYDDSLSYYEVLAKVGEKMNEVITGLNANNEQVEKVTGFTIEQVQNLTTAFNNFQQSMLTRQENFENTLNQDVNTWETQIEGDIADWKAETEEAFNKQYQDFLDKYNKQFGVVQKTGDSITDVISQKASTDLFFNFRGTIPADTTIDYNWLHDNSNLGSWTWYHTDSHTISGLPNDLNLDAHGGTLTAFDTQIVVTGRDKQNTAEIGVWIGEIISEDGNVITWHRVNLKNAGNVVQNLGDNTVDVMSQKAVSLYNFNAKKSYPNTPLTKEWVDNEKNIGVYDYYLRDGKIEGFPENINFQHGGVLCVFRYCCILTGSENSQFVVYIGETLQGNSKVTWTKLADYNYMNFVYRGEFHNTPVDMNNLVDIGYYAIAKNKDDTSELKNFPDEIMSLSDFYGYITVMPYSNSHDFVTQRIYIGTPSSGMQHFTRTIFTSNGNTYIEWEKSIDVQQNKGNNPADVMSQKASTDLFFNYRGTIPAGTTIDYNWLHENSNLGSWEWYHTDNHTISGLPNDLSLDARGGTLTAFDTQIVVTGRDKQNTAEIGVWIGEIISGDEYVITWHRVELQKTKPTLGVCGDSFCAGNYEYQSTSMAELMNNYGYYGVNMSTSGIKASNWWDTWEDFAKANPCDIYLIALGLNHPDVGDDDGDGVITDEPANGGTFVAGIKFIIEELTKINPHSRIILWGMDAWFSEKRANLLKEIGKMYGLETYCMLSDLNIPIRINGKYASVATLNADYVKTKNEAFQHSIDDSHPNEQARILLAQYWSSII